MKMSYKYASSLGSVECCMPDGEKVTLPVVAGILKHPSADMLPMLLSKPEAAYKYSFVALQKAAWPVLRLFPRKWLLHCISKAKLRPSREKALLFLLAD